MPSTKATIKEKLIEQLLANGHTEQVPRLRHTTPKYVTFDIPNDPDLRYGNIYFLFVGKAGALRRGRIASDSMPDDGLKANLLAQWDAKHPKRGSKPISEK